MRNKFIVFGNYLWFYHPMFKLTIPTKEPERWAIIKCQLEIKGYSLQKLATEIGVSRSSMVSTRKVFLYKNQKAIADKLGVKPEEIWPERYGDDGNPKYHSSRYPRSKSTTSTGKRQRQIMWAYQS